MSTVYLAGPISGLSFDGADDWRKQASDYFSWRGIVPLSPLRGKGYLADKTTIADQYDEYVLSSQKAITTRDRWDCIRADVVLVNVLGAKKVSIGTVMECGWADSARNPIVLVMEEGNIHDHAMLREVSGYIVSTLEEGLWVVERLLCV